jgi:hypothetical protein
MRAARLHRDRIIVLMSYAVAAAIVITVVTALRAGQETSTGASRQTKVRAGDGETLESTLDGLYDTISGPAGSRDWDRLRKLFLPGARLIPAIHRPDGTTEARVLSVDEFINASEPRLKEMGFYEREIHRRVERFGSVAHVFSTYESRHAPSDVRPFARGINSIQLFHDGKRWWVVTIFWDAERPGQTIPAEFAPGS